MTRISTWGTNPKSETLLPVCFHGGKRICLFMGETWFILQYSRTSFHDFCFSHSVYRPATTCTVCIGRRDGQNSTDPDYLKRYLHCNIVRQWSDVYFHSLYRQFGACATFTGPNDYVEMHEKTFCQWTEFSFFQSVQAVLMVKQLSQAN